MRLLTQSLLLASVAAPLLGRVRPLQHFRSVFQHVVEVVRELRIELFEATINQVLDSTLAAHHSAIDRIRRHRVECIGNAEHPGSQW